MSKHTNKWGQEDKTQIELNDIILSLKNVLEKKISNHWHAVYLQKYISANIVPFGLRLKLFPHFKNPSENFKQNWETDLTNCFIELMSLLVHEHKQEIAQADIELKPMPQKLNELKNPPEQAEKEKELDNHLE